MAENPSHSEVDDDSANQDAHLAFVRTIYLFPMSNEPSWADDAGQLVGDAYYHADDLAGAQRCARGRSDADLCRATFLDPTRPGGAIKNVGIEMSIQSADGTADEISGDLTGTADDVVRRAAETLVAGPVGCLPGSAVEEVDKDSRVVGFRETRHFADRVQGGAVRVPAGDSRQVEEACPLAGDEAIHQRGIGRGV